MRDRRVWQDAVTKIEDKRTVRESGENGVDCTIKRRAACHQNLRIEIALDRPPALNVLARIDVLDHPVEPDRVDRDFIDIAWDVGCRPTRKADHLGGRYVSSQRLDDPPRRLDAPAREFRGWQHTGPC